MMKKISIIIPMYNVAGYLEKCLGSVFNQGLGEDEYEIIMIDDESPDSSVTVASKLTAKKNNVKIISQKNRGLGGARNTGIKNSTGDYLLFLDADDRLLPSVLSGLLDTAQLHNLDILEFGAQGINSDNEILYEIKNTSEVLTSGFEYYNKIRYMNSACNKLYKRNFLIENNFFFLEKIYIEDFEFNTRCLASARSLKATDLVASQFLQSLDSITRNNDEVKKQKMMSDIIFVIKTTDKLYHNKSTNNTQSYFYLERLNFLVATLFYQLVKRKASYKEMNALKIQLEKEGLFYVNHKIFDSRKNIFRILFLQNLWTFKLYNIFNANNVR